LHENKSCQNGKSAASLSAIAPHIFYAASKVLRQGNMVRRQV
jgi:hypothetical protein